MRRYFSVLVMCLGVMVLTGASPIADLFSRVEALETENQLLSQQIVLLEIEAGLPLIVRDASGLELGPVLNFGGVTAAVGISAAGLPSGRLRVARLSVKADEGNARLLFTSSDCQGAPFLPPVDPHDPGRVSVFAPAFAFEDGSSAYLGTTVEHPGFDTMFLSRLNSSSRVCDNTPTIIAAVPAEEVSGWSFTPPFQVVTRGDLVEP